MLRRDVLRGCLQGTPRRCSARPRCLLPGAPPNWLGNRIRCRAAQQRRTARVLFLLHSSPLKVVRNRLIGLPITLVDVLKTPIDESARCRPVRALDSCDAALDAIQAVFAGFYCRFTGFNDWHMLRSDVIHRDSVASDAQWSDTLALGLSACRCVTAHWSDCRD
jgi:hypothetical protein